MVNRVRFRSNNVRSALRRWREADSAEAGIPA